MNFKNITKNQILKSIEESNSLKEVLTRLNLSLTTLKLKCKQFNIDLNLLKYKKHAWNKGLTKTTNESVKRYSEKKVGKHLSNDTKIKIGLKNKGKIIKEETRKKIAIKNKGKHLSQITKNKISLKNKGKKRSSESKEKNRQKHLGRKLSKEQKEIYLLKSYMTKKKNKSFNSSKPEKEFKKFLIKKFGEKDVFYQYKDSRYPWYCDFYIKSEDLFIELNLTWTHGGHKFNKLNLEDIKTLNYWKNRAQESNYYKTAVKVWTELDVIKQKTAKQNNLKYITLYTKEELYKFMKGKKIW